MEKQAPDTNALSPFALDNKVAIITGGASGLGQATAKLFANVGATVVILDIDASGAEKTAAQIRDAGGSATSIPCDLEHESHIVSAFDSAVAAHGRVDIAVNCAAYRRKAEFMEMTEAEWNAMFNITARGTFYVMRAAIKHMIANKIEGSIVNVSSISAQRAVIFANAHYDAAKAGVDALTRSAAIEFSEHKIRINCVAPGGINTPGLENIKSSINFRGPATIAGRLPFGFAEPIEIARAILFLASPAASYITGRILAVDGGHLIT